MITIETQNLDESSIGRMSQRQKLWAYNGLDCCLTLEIFEKISAQLDNISGGTYVFSLDLQAAFLEMSLRGVAIDFDERRRLIAEYKEMTARLDEQLTRILAEGVGTKLNWKSPKQLGQLFYDVIGLAEKRKRGADGQMSRTTNRDALEKLRSYLLAEPIVNHILLLRDIEKKLQFLEMGIDSDGRIRTSYNVAGTNTGRPSSSTNEFGTGGNLQNVERKLRRIIVADKGMKFCNVDLEQADSRNVGARCWNIFYASHGPKFAGAYLDACESGDLHTAVTRMCWSELPWPEDPALWRKIADEIAYREFSYRDLAKKLGHGCLTEDHEVLTRSGWVPITEQPDEILTWTPAKSEFQRVLSWADFLYTGDLHYFEGNSLSACMTADHRIPFVRDQKSEVLRESIAAEGPKPHMPLGCGYIGGSVSVPGDLIAAIMSDGELTGKKTRFNFNKPRKVERLKTLCTLHGVTWTEHPDGRISINYWHPKNAGAYMLNWTAESLDAFLREYKFWDGHSGKTSTALFSANREHLLWIQTLGRLRGIGGNLQKPQTSGYGTTMWRLQQNNRKYASGSSVCHTNRPVRDVRVLCPSVPATWFYVRRNGKIFVTGNSNYMGTPPTMAMHTKMPQQVIKDFQRKYLGEAFPCIPEWHKWVQRQLEREHQLTTFLGRRRYFFGNPRDAATLREAVAYEPQSLTADEIDTALLRVRKHPHVQPLLQVHDSLLFQYPEEMEDEIVPWALETMKVQIDIGHGREFYVPVEAKIGWNWADADAANEDGLKKWKGHDTRTRTIPAPSDKSPWE